MAFPTTAARRDLIVGRDLTSGGTIITEPFYLETEQPIFWGDSHESIMPVAKRYATGSDGIATISLPNTSQAGWKDSAQQAITGWHYKITRTVGGQKTTVIFALPSGVGPVYLNDLVRENPTAPVTVAYQGVLTVNGVGPDGTGNVAVAGGGGGGGASDLASISDMSVIARTFNAQTTAAAIRSTLGAGTSDLGLGTSGSTAKAGNYQPTAADISDSSATGRTVLTGTASAARGAIGAGTASTKADVGLGSVDNTSDAGKPVSTAQQSALDAKANLSTLGSYVLSSTKNANSGVAGLDASAHLTLATAPAGYIHTYRCPGGVQPLRATITNRTDIFIVWAMPTEPVKASVTPGYAIDGDGWAVESW